VAVSHVTAIIRLHHGHDRREDLEEEHEEELVVIVAEPALSLESLLSRPGKVVGG
jgi:hypothetical protein